MKKKRIAAIMIIIAALLVITVLFFFFFFIIPPERSLFIEPVYHFNTNRKIVALTFDDGPSSEWTPLLLDLLKRKSVKATFFMTGEKILKNRKIAERVIKEGHGIGNHTFHHNRMIFRTKRFIEDDIINMDKIFKSIGAADVTLYRPPYGLKFFNLPLILGKTGKKMITWDVEPKFQYDRNRVDCEKDVDFILTKTKPGSIILLHDGWSGNPALLLCTVEQAIDRLRKKDYIFVTINEGLKIDKTSNK